MDKIATENLFLLEFLVDKVELNQKCQCDAPPGETCVSFQFLDNAPLDVCEADFAPKRNYRDATDTSTKSGKSCLFSLSPDQADICLDTFDINVTIWRKMLPGWLPEKVEIGQALISIANLFAELISTVEASDGSVPTAKTLKDDFDITNDRGDNQGKITVYIRMSCFGKLIITQFQMNLGEKSVLFKDKEGKSLYRYKKAGKGGNGGGCTIRGSTGGYGGMDYPPSPYGSGPMQAQYGGMGYNSGCPTSPCGGDQYGRGNMGQGRGNMGGNMGSNPYATGNMGGNPYATGNVGGNQYGMTNQYGAAPANPNSNCPFSACGRSQPETNGGIGENGRGSYQVGGGGTGENGSIGGNGGDPFGQRQVPCMECGSLPNPSCLLPGQGMGGPGAMESMGGGARLMTPCLECGGLPSPPCLGGGQGPVRLTPCQECGGLPNPPCGAGTCGGATPCTECAGNPNAPCLNMGPCDYCPEPPSDGKEGGDKEVFVLKIGKKKEGTDKKPRMELELITPKAPVVKPIPKLETRDTQYDSKDVNGKGKNGKGKKKKK